MAITPDIEFSWNVLFWESKDIELAANNVGRSHQKHALQYLLIREPGGVIGGKKVLDDNMEGP